MAEKTNCEKPPLGAIPKWLWNENRVDSLGGAIKRYIEHRMEIPIIWVEEYNELLAEVKGDAT